MCALAPGRAALCLYARHRLAGPHICARAARDVAGRGGDAVNRRAGAVSGDAEGVATTVVAREGGRSSIPEMLVIDRETAAYRITRMRVMTAEAEQDYCFASETE